MAVQLFEHNQKAYGAVEAMLSSGDKAAVIHPTGTPTQKWLWTMSAS